MSKRIPSIVPTLSATSLVAVIALSMNCPAHATAECIEQPNQQPTDGAHWYYRLDRAKNRKCWYLGRAELRLPDAETPQGPSGSVPTPIFSSVFSSLFGGSVAAVATAAPQDTAVREPRIIQPNPTKILKTDDIVRKGQPSIPEERAEERHPPPLRQAQRDALFQKFLRWDESQRNFGDAGAPLR